MIKKSRKALERATHRLSFALGWDARAQKRIRQEIAAIVRNRRVGKAALISFCEHGIPTFQSAFWNTGQELDEEFRCNAHGFITAYKNYANNMRVGKAAINNDAPSIGIPVCITVVQAEG